MKYCIHFLVAMFLCHAADAQTDESEAMYVLMDEADALMIKEVHSKQKNDYRATYYVYDEALMHQKQEALKKHKGILPEGFCDYYYFDTYDPGKRIDEAYLHDKKVYTRKEMVNHGIHTQNIFGLERQTDGYIVRKLFFTACE